MTFAVISTVDCNGLKALVSLVIRDHFSPTSSPVRLTDIVRDAKLESFKYRTDLYKDPGNVSGSVACFKFSHYKPFKSLAVSNTPSLNCLSRMRSSLTHQLCNLSLGDGKRSLILNFPSYWLSNQTLVVTSLR